MLRSFMSRSRALTRRTAGAARWCSGEAAHTDIRQCLALVPASGASIADVVDLWRQATGRADVTEAELLSQLKRLGDAHVVSHDRRIIPVQWPLVMAAVAARLPPEGVLEQPFLRLVATECVPFQQARLQIPTGTTTRAWVTEYFPSAIVARSAFSDPSHVVYRPVPRHSGAALALQAALRAVARDNVTRWVDADVIREAAPQLLPRDVRAAELAALGVDSDVRLVVRLKQTARQALVVLDETAPSFTDEEASRVAAAALQEASGVRMRTTRLIAGHRGSAGRQGGVAESSGSTVVVDPFLETVDVVCATLLEDASAVQIVVCADEATARQYAAAVERDCGERSAFRELIFAAPGGFHLRVTSRTKEGTGCASQKE